MRAKGIDISKYQNKFTYKENIDFCIIKATEGWGVDKYFLQNVNEVMKVPVRGAYHYYRTATAPIIQADNFLAYVKDRNFHFLCVDWEHTNNDLNPQTANDYVAMLEYLSLNQDLPVLVYTSPYIYRDELSNWEPIVHEYPKWIARYSGADIETGSPTTGIIDNVLWDIWQYSSKGNGPLYGTSRVEDSYTDKIDLNVYNGTPEDMKKRLGVEEEDCCAELFTMIRDTDRTLAGYAKYNNDRVDELIYRVQELEKRPWWMRWF